MIVPMFLMLMKNNSILKIIFKIGTLELFENQCINVVL